MSGGEWLRTSYRADNFWFCKYSSVSIDWVFLFVFFYIYIYLKLLIALMLILKIWFFWNPMFALCIFIGSLHILDYMQYSLLPLSVEVQVWSSQYRTSSIGVRRTVLCIILDCSFKEHCTVSTSEWQIDELQQYLFVNVPHNENAILVWLLCWNTVLIS